MIVTLRRIDPWGAERQVVLAKFPAILGRGEPAQVRVADPSLSRIHCVFEMVETTLHVRDLDSSNGTLVNGQPVMEAVLAKGDQLTVGGSTFEIVLREKWCTRLWQGCCALMSSLTSLAAHAKLSTQTTPNGSEHNLSS